MQREQVDEAEKDAMIKAAEDAAWAKREATWRRDRAARARLMEQVAQERAQQLAEKGGRFLLFKFGVWCSGRPFGATRFRLCF